MVDIRVTTFFSLLVAIWAVMPTYAQVDDSVFVNPARLYLDVSALSFLRNSEYFNPVVAGQTTAGFQLQPTLRYQPVSYITAKVGLFGRRYWADPKFLSTFLPTFSIGYEKKSVAFMIGNLEREASRIIPPFYNPEQTFLDPPATGLAFYYKRNLTFLHIWLHWLSLLDKMDNRPEELTTGLLIDQVVVKFRAITCQVPLHVILYHLGGQGIAVKDFSLWLYSLGGRITYNLKEESVLKSISLAGHYVTNAYIKKVQRPFKKGHGLLIQASCNANWLNLQVNYWLGNRFCSENIGHPLYQSIAILHKQVVYQTLIRHLILLHIEHISCWAEGLSLVVYLDPYYDIKQRLFEHEAGLSIVYQPCFRLEGYKVNLTD